MYLINMIRHMVFIAFSFAFSAPFWAPSVFCHLTDAETQIDTANVETRNLQSYGGAHRYYPTQDYQMSPPNQSMPNSLSTNPNDYIIEGYGFNGGANPLYMQGQNMLGYPIAGTYSVFSTATQEAPQSYTTPNTGVGYGGILGNLGHRHGLIGALLSAPAAAEQVSTDVNQRLHWLGNGMMTRAQGYASQRPQESCWADCSSSHQYIICGSDGITYPTECHFRVAYCLNPGLQVYQLGVPCSNLLAVSQQPVHDQQQYPNNPNASVPTPSNNMTTKNNLQPPSSSSSSSVNSQKPQEEDRTLRCDLNCSQQQYQPVCGSDGVTYGNMCVLQLEACLNPASGLTLLKMGSCDGTIQPRPTEPSTSTAGATGTVGTVGTVGGVTTTMNQHESRQSSTAVSPSGTLANNLITSLPTETVGDAVVQRVGALLRGEPLAPQAPGPFRITTLGSSIDSNASAHLTSSAQQPPVQIPVQQTPVRQPPVQTPVRQPPVHTPVQQTPVQQQPVETPVQQQPVQTPVQQPPVRQPPVERPVQQPPVQQPQVRQPPVETPVQQPPVQRPVPASVTTTVPATPINPGTLTDMIKDRYQSVENTITNAVNVSRDVIFNSPKPQNGFLSVPQNPNVTTDLNLIEPKDEEPQELPTAPPAMETTETETETETEATLPQNDETETVNAKSPPGIKDPTTASPPVAETATSSHLDVDETPNDKERIGNAEGDADNEPLDVAEGNANRDTDDTDVDAGADDLGTGGNVNTDVDAADEDDGEISNAQLDIIVSDAKDKSPDSQDEQSAIPAQEEQSAIPAQEEQSSIPAQEEQSAIPAQEEQSAIPAQEEQSAIPAQEEQSAIPAQEEQFAIPAQEEQNSSPNDTDVESDNRETFKRDDNISAADLATAERTNENDIPSTETVVSVDSHTTRTATEINAKHFLSARKDNGPVLTSLEEVRDKQIPKPHTVAPRVTSWLRGVESDIGLPPVGPTPTPTPTTWQASGGETNCKTRCPITTDKVCSDNGITFMNQCELEVYACLLRVPIQVKHRGECK